MATWIRAGETGEEVQPKNGKHWTLAELQNFVGGYIETAPTIDGRLLVVNEDGKSRGLPFNEIATRLYRWHQHDHIVGNAVLVTLEEMKRAKG